jgi:hypothetical protein
MITIYKYKLGGQQNSIELPLGSEVLTMQLQNGEPHIWVKLDDQVIRTETHVFNVVGTGWGLDEIGKYIGTYQTPNMFVFHVFHEEPKNN